MATTTPNYGWDVPTSTDYVKDGATAIETLGDDIDATLWTALGGAYPGLRLIKKQTIGTGVSSVAVTSAFSATYDNYKIMVAGGSFSGNDYLTLSFSANSHNYSFNYVDYSGASSYARGANTASFAFMGYGYSGDGITASIDVMSPFLAKRTAVNASASGELWSGTCTGIHKQAISYSGFTLATGGATMTGGTIYVYGYGAS